MFILWETGASVARLGRRKRLPHIAFMPLGGPPGPWGPPSQSPQKAFVADCKEIQAKRYGSVNLLQAA